MTGESGVSPQERSNGLREEHVHGSPEEAHLADPEPAHDAGHAQSHPGDQAALLPPGAMMQPRDDVASASGDATIAHDEETMTHGLATPWVRLMEMPASRQSSRATTVRLDWPTREENEMTERVRFSAEEARHVGEEIGIDWSSAPFDVEQFRQGMGVELEHGLHDLITNVTNGDPLVTGKIALAHLKEFPDYYTRLARMEDEARRDGQGP